MPKRVVYFSELNNVMKDELLKKGRRYIRENKGDKFYYILPSGNLIFEYRKMFLEGMPGGFDINIITFDDIANNMMNLKNKKYIDSEIKKSILNNIMKELKNEGKINYYGDIAFTKGFINDISKIIGKIKQSLISPEDFLKRCPDTQYYKEIGLIYQEYERFLNKKNIADREGTFFNLLENENKAKRIFENLDFIIIDQFFDFRPQEFQILKLMAKVNVDIYINMPFKTDRYYNTVGKTVEDLESIGFTTDFKDYKERNYFEIIGNKLFGEEREIFVKNDNIKLIKASDNYAEIKRIAYEIKKTADKGIKLNDIGLILCSNKYLDVVFKVFKEEKIKFSINEERKLSETPLIRDILNILILKINKFDRKGIINRIKSYYFNLTEEGNKGEFLLRKFKFKDIDDLILAIEEEKNIFSDFIKKGRDDMKDNFKEIGILYEAIIGMRKEADSIPDQGNIDEMICSVMEIIEKYGLEEKILDIYNETGDYDIFYRDFISYSKMADILMKMKENIPMVYETISFEKFFRIFKNYLDDENIVETIGDKDGINILTPLTLEGTDYNTVFMAGLSQENYPGLRDENFFFSEENYWNLKDIGIDVKNYNEKMDKEGFLFVLGITRCRERLYLSYCESSEDEGSIPSIFLDEFLNLFKGDKIEEKINIISVDMNYLFELPFGGCTADEGRIGKNIKCEIEREKGKFNEYNGFIDSNEIQNDIEGFLRNKKYSVTFFETYGKCHYRFLMDYILNIQGMERDIKEFTPLDRGNIFHQVLKEYYVFHKKDFEKHVSGEKAFDMNSIPSEIEKRVVSILKSNGVKNINKVWQIRINSIADSIIKLIDSDLKRIVQGGEKLLPYDFEVEFGKDYDFPLNLKDRTINVMGKIDRLDKFYGDEKYVIYDYKTSSYGIRNIDDIMKGVSFQLPVYIMSQKSKNIVAGAYIIISNGNVKFQMVKEEGKKLFGPKKRSGILKPEEWTSIMNTEIENMNNYLNNIEKGDFSINPRECDDYCPYREICRY